MIEAEYGEWLARGQAHQQAARPIDAMLCYRQALKSNRNAVQVQFQLGEVLRDLGCREEALAAFRMALTWQPKHLSSLVALAGMLRATAPAEAAVYYRHAAVLDHTVQHALARLQRDVGMAVQPAGFRRLRQRHQEC